MGRNCFLVLPLLGVFVANGMADEPREPVNLPGGGKLENVNFERHVMALVGKLGCNAGSCHGSFQGRGSFQLSLFGYDFEMDHKAIVEWVDTDDAADSYLFEKATLATEHGGGKRFDKDSWQYRVIHEWIANGAARKAGSGTVTSLDVLPGTVRFRGPGETQQMKVIATFADGTRENVTPFCEFRIGDDYVIELKEGGFLKSLNPGDTPLAVQYRGEVQAAQVLVPSPAGPRFVYPKVATRNEIDRLVVLKLRQLNVVPSKNSDDMEFLRRVTIDTIGRLPSPDEVRAFVADQNPQKRRKKINELLDHPLHAALWATKLSDITGNDTTALENPREKRSKMWHDWFRVRLERNAPWDEIAAGVLTATSREEQEPQAWVTAARTIDEAIMTSFDSDYAKRDTLDLFWQRRNLASNALAEGVAAAFLGVRLQCAQCHKHPYDRWTQADYRSFVNVFGQVKNGTSPQAKGPIDAENKRRKGIKDNKRKLPSLREVFVAVNSPSLMNDPKTNQRLTAKALGGPEFSGDEDWRNPLVAWMREKDNPFFARAFVNRVWGHYFGKGIVDPVDDFSIANPPSNPELLDWLASEFVAHRFDIRHIEQLVLNSRTYQQSSFPNDTNMHDKRNFARSYPRRMMAETVVDVLNTALGVEQRFNADAPAGSSAIEVAATSVRDGNLRYAFRVFGRPDRKSACDCERSDSPSLSQTLFMMTDQQVLGRIRNGRLRALVSDERGRRLRDGSIDSEELDAILDELSLAVLTRYPTSAERRKSIQHIRRKEDRVKALADVVWAMLNSREFLLIH